MMDKSPYLPPEWAPHRVVWVGWPRLEEEWSRHFEPARAEIADFVDVLASAVPVRVAVGDDAAARTAKRILPGAVEIIRIPTGDIWLRDTGPVFLSSGKQTAAAAFRFNGWGGKYDMPGDRKTAAALARREGIEAECMPFILEGGAIDGDGTGTVLTTRQCLLHKNRNGWHQTAAELALKTALGATSVQWIERGLDGDHTDGHVDNVARFVGPGRVVCQRPSTTSDPHTERLEEVEQQLRAMGFDVETIVAPGPICDTDGQPAPASHLNFVITNGLVIVPVFDRDTGDEACKALQTLFPEREVVGLPAGSILFGGGGAFHCMTCHVPDPGAVHV